MLSNVDVTATFLRHPDSRIFHIHIQPGGSLTPATSHKLTKIRKVCRLHLTGHTLLPCFADPHVSRIRILAMFPYVSADSPYDLQAPKIPTLVSTGPVFSASPAGAVPHVQIGHQIRRDQRPVHSNLRIRPTYSNSLRRREGHGYGVASRCDDAGVAATCRRQVGQHLHV